MKKSKFLIALALPFLLVSCGKGGNEPGPTPEPTPTPQPTPDPKPDPTPDPKPDPKPEPTVIDFASMSDKEVYEFFSVKEGTKITENFVVNYLAPFTTIDLENVSNYKSEYARKDDVCRESYTSSEKMSFPRSQAVELARILIENDSVTEDNVEDFWQSYANEMSSEYSLIDGTIFINKPEVAGDPEYLAINPDKIYSEKYSYDYAKDVYIASKVINPDSFMTDNDDVFVDFKKGISYNKEEDVYSIDLEKVNKYYEGWRTYTKLEFKVENDMYKSANINYSYEFDGILSEIAITEEVSSFDETITLPEVGTCEHYLSVNPSQVKSDKDGNYYHYYYCLECSGYENIEICTFEVDDDTCTVCNQTPIHDKIVYSSDVEGDFFFVLNVKDLNNKLHSAYADSDNLWVDYIDFENCVFTSITFPEEMEVISSVNLWVGEDYSYIFFEGLIEGENEYYSIVETTVTEEEGIYTITGGMVFEYTQNQIITND